MADTRLQTWVTKEEKAEWEKAADEIGLKFPDFVREALNLFAGFDPFFLRQVKARAGKLNISPAIVIQNTIAKRLADDQAKYEVYGPAPQILTEFQFTEDGPVPFEALLENLTDNAVRRYEDEKAEMLRKDKGYGIQLAPEDEEWLRDYSYRRGEYRRFFAEKDEEK